ncbi:MAG: hypothetical protein AAGJ35_04885, partial [Myxococcota bacterium]
QVYVLLFSHSVHLESTALGALHPKQLVPLQVRALLKPRLWQSGPIFVAWFAILFWLFNTTLGRNILDGWAYRWRSWLLQVRDRWILGLLAWVMSVFQRMMVTLYYALYRVDDLLCFHEGESSVAIVLKTGLQMIWYVFTYMIRFCVILVAEPQLNPIKHFPVVTLSHKMIIPFSIEILNYMKDNQYHIAATTFVFLFLQFGLPGIFGFLAWELRANWKLFKENQSETPEPIVMGSHGERVENLLRRGFHSGTLPRAYERYYALYRDQFWKDHNPGFHEIQHDLEHVRDDLQTFIQREWITTCHLDPLLQKAQLHFSVQTLQVFMQHIDFCIQVERASHPILTWKLRLEWEKGWLLADLKEYPERCEEKAFSSHTVQRLELSLTEREACNRHWVYFLQKAGVKIVRAKLEKQLQEYLRDCEIIQQGSAGSELHRDVAEYWVDKQYVNVFCHGHGMQISSSYELSADGQLREAAHCVSLQRGDVLVS